jgi:hypothetical protein
MKRARAGLLLLACLGLLPLRADYLINTDLKDSLAGWHGDAQRVLLLPDGSEGAATDTDAVPVIKLKLGSQRESVYQEYEIRDQPASVTITVDVYASSDYQPGSDDMGFGDLWLRDEPAFFERLAHPKPGQWITVTAKVYRLRGTDHVLSFNVPPGQGAVYLKNIHAAP